MPLTKKDLSQIEKLIDQRLDKKLDEKIGILPTKKEFLHWMDKIYSQMTRMETEMIAANNRIGRNEYSIDINSQRLNSIENRFKSHQKPALS